MMPLVVIIKTFSHFSQVNFFFQWLQFEKLLGSWGKEELDKDLCLKDLKIIVSRELKNSVVCLAYSLSARQTWKELFYYME